jgi:hypothetical protein
VDHQVMDQLQGSRGDPQRGCGKKGSLSVHELPSWCGRDTADRAATHSQAKDH